MALAGRSPVLLGHHHGSEQREQTEASALTIFMASSSIAKLVGRTE